MKLTICCTFHPEGPKGIPEMFCLIRWLLDIEAIPHEAKYAPEQACALCTGKIHPRRGFVILAEEGDPPYTDRVMVDIYDLARYIDEKGLRRI